MSDKAVIPPQKAITWVVTTFAGAIENGRYNSVQFKEIYWILISVINSDIVSYKKRHTVCHLMII